MNTEELLEKYLYDDEFEICRQCKMFNPVMEECMYSKDEDGMVVFCYFQPKDDVVFKNSEVSVPSVVIQ